jgi:uncharacterized lipoprotein YmbA
VRSGFSGGQLAIAEPVSIQALEAERIIVKDPSGAVSFLGGGQWADRLPRLVQTRLVQTFENSGVRAVARSGDRIVADYQITTDIRAFQVDAATREAVVEISARLIQDRTGRIVNARIFSARAPVASIDAPAAARGSTRRSRPCSPTSCAGPDPGAPPWPRARPPPRRPESTHSGLGDRAGRLSRSARRRGPAWCRPCRSPR